MTRFETPRREVWLTIDDGPDPVHTPKMLALLRDFEAKATFFVIGQRAAQFPDLVKAIRDAGHEVANHTATHPSASFWAFTPRQIAREIDQPGLAASCFRTPGGAEEFLGASRARSSRLGIDRLVNARAGHGQPRPGKSWRPRPSRY